MKKLLTLCMVVFFCVVAGGQTNSALVTLSKGSEIKLAMAQTLSSKHAYVGQRVELQVAEDVTVGDVIVVPKGTRVLGTVTAGKKDENKHNNPETVSLRIDYISIGDRHILLTGDYTDKGKIDKGAVVVGTVLFGVAGLVATLGTRHGDIAEGTELRGSVAEDIQLPTLGHASAKAPPTTNEEKQQPPATH